MGDGKLSEQGTSDFARGGWIPPGLTEAQLEPGECVVDPRTWRCVRGDPAHAEAGHDVEHGMTVDGEYREGGA